jgi:diguanylate cyclase (GGDEF)-like protein/PAS domain S-box-containing protein
MGLPGIPWDTLPSGVAAALTRVADAPTWQDEIDVALSEIGAALGVERCYVFQNLRGPEGRLWMDLVAEWDEAGIRPIFDDPSNRLHPYFPDFARWIDEMSEGRALAGTLASLPESAALVLGAEGTVATVQAPVIVRGDWWGFAGIDLCRGDAEMSGQHEAMVWHLAATLAHAVGRDLAVEDEQLRADLYRSLVERGPAAAYIDGVDPHASTIYISPQIAQILGYTPEEWYEDPELWSTVLHPDDRERAFDENARHNETGEPFRLEYRMFHKDGRVVWVHDEATMVRDRRGMPRYSHGVLLDVTDRKKGEQHPAHGVYHDELTGLPSRAMFEELLELSIARARRAESAVAVLCVDLDDFRLVNDSLGHQTGDVLLRAIAERLRDATRETDLVARRGGDQFLLLLADLDADERSSSGALARSQAVAQRIQDSLARSFTVYGKEVYLPASIGISVFPFDAEDTGSVLRNVESAMHEAKRVGSSTFMMATGDARGSGERLDFVTRLRKAVDARRWTLHYQPVLELESGRMTGVEALIRWIEPDGTTVPPLEFIPVAEELGLIEQIGAWVVREISYQVQAWRELDLDLEVGFNLSPRQFWQPDLAKRIVSELRDAGVDLSKLVVEITESSAMIDPVRAQEILTELHDAGFTIAIDDFGTGYSSLSRLREMPVDILKIDRSFVTGVHEDRGASAIVSAFLDLAQGLGMRTLAEGIETEEELAFLRERGCQQGQGFLFARPVPPEEIIAYAFGGLPSSSVLRAR